MYFPIDCCGYVKRKIWQPQRVNTYSGTLTYAFFGHASSVVERIELVCRGTTVYGFIKKIPPYLRSSDCKELFA